MSHYGGVVDLSLYHVPPEYEANSFGAGPSGFTGLQGDAPLLL